MTSTKRPPLAAELAVGFVLLSGVCAAFWWMFANLDTSLTWQRAWDDRVSLKRSWLVTLQVSAGSLVGSTVVAIALLGLQRTRSRVLTAGARMFIEFVRGMPLMALIMMGYYMVFGQSTVSRALASIGLEELFAGAVLLSIFTGAYLSEILRGGLESIPQAQIDSARAVGFDRWQGLRYVLLPQALRRVLPALVGQFVNLIKDSSLLSIIAIQELTYASKVFNSKTYGGIEAFLPMTAGYLLLTLPMAFAARAVERRYRCQT